MVKGKEKKGKKYKSCFLLVYIQLHAFANMFNSSIIFQALLTGCSAGGLATLIHCDDFQARLPKSANVKCLADGSLFLDKYIPSTPL